MRGVELSGATCRHDQRLGARGVALLVAVPSRAVESGAAASLTGTQAVEWSWQGARSRGSKALPGLEALREYLSACGLPSGAQEPRLTLVQLSAEVRSVPSPKVPPGHASHAWARTLDLSE